MKLTIQASSRSVKDGRIWLPERGGCSGGWFPLANPDILTESLRHYRVTLRDGKAVLKAE